MSGKYLEMYAKRRITAGYRQRSAPKKMMRPTRPRKTFSRQTRLPATLSSNRPEIKAVDLKRATYTLNATAVFTAINLIQAGSSFANRVGRRVEMVSLRIVGFAQVLRTAAEDFARILIVYDRQVNGANPALADVIQDTAQDLTNATDAQSGVNLNNRDRFSVIRDFRLKLPAVTDTASVITNLGTIDPVAVTFKVDFYAKLPRLVTQFKADSNPAVIGDIATGGLFMITTGLLNAGTEGFNFPCTVRLRFKDI